MVGMVMIVVVVVIIMLAFSVPMVVVVVIMVMILGGGVGRRMGQSFLLQRGVHQVRGLHGGENHAVVRGARGLQNYPH